MRPQLVQEVPGVDSRVVQVVKADSKGIVAHGFHSQDAHIAAARGDLRYGLIDLTRQQGATRKSLTVVQRKNVVLIIDNVRLFIDHGAQHHHQEETSIWFWFCGLFPATERPTENGSCS